MNDYYRTTGIREICHDIKNVRANRDAILTVAEYLSRYTLDKNCILIPAPQHYGYADYTKKVADLVAKATGAKVLDILKCEKRERLYDYKRSC